MRVLAGTESLVEYVYVSKRVCNCRVWEFWAILVWKMGRVLSAPSLHRESTDSLIPHRQVYGKAHAPFILLSSHSLCRGAAAPSSARATAESSTVICVWVGMPDYSITCTTQEYKVKTSVNVYFLLQYCIFQFRLNINIAYSASGA